MTPSENIFQSLPKWNKMALIIDKDEKCKIQNNEKYDSSF